MDDSKIIELFFLRNEDAIRHTHDIYGRRLFILADNIVKDDQDAEESVNDTYLAAWNSMPPHRPSVLPSYLAKLTRRISIDCFRGKTRAKRMPSEYVLSLSELDDCVSGGNSTEEIINVKFLADAIGVYLRLQSPEARNAFIGRYYYLDSLKEVARYCGMSESKAKSLLYRTRVGLKEYLQKEGFNL